MGQFRVWVVSRVDTLKHSEVIRKNLMEEIEYNIVEDIVAGTIAKL